MSASSRKRQSLPITPLGAAAPAAASDESKRRRVDTAAEDAVTSVVLFEPTDGGKFALLREQNQLHDLCR
jgi:hypothetical protein